jgi:glycosyltransferase involved in cell wall biosynthesis
MERELMKINFILPGRGRRFSGGFKVMYEYASRMQQKGHNVTLIHTPYRSPYGNTVHQLKSDISYLYGLVRLDHWSANKIFDFPKDLTQIWIPSMSEKTIPDADITVISFWHSALFSRKLSKNKGKVLYLVQEYEMYMTASKSIRNYMERGFSLCDAYAAISPSVENMLKECGTQVDAYIPNGIELENFKCSVPLTDVSRKRIGFPWRQESFKGTDLAVRVLEKIREQSDENLSIWAFGAKPKIKIPDWLEFYESPTTAELEALYNQTMVFVTPSQYEGWGLPGSEAMACGAALVSTDSGGVNGYARSNYNALISNYNDENGLYENIMKIISNQSFRLDIALNGINDIQYYSWQKAENSFEMLLVKMLNS